MEIVDTKRKSFDL